MLAAPGAQAQNAGGRKIVILGDSLSSGYGLARGTGWVALLDQRLTQLKAGWQVVNASIGGDTTSGGRSRLPALLKQHRPAVLVVELGGNDALRGLPLNMTEANLDAIVKAGLQAGAKVLLVGNQVPPNYGQRYTNDFAALFPKIAQANKVPVVPFMLKGVADTPDAADNFQADRIHPLAKAHPLILDNIWAELRKLLGV
ncbi:MAG: Esterase TesA [Paracidovorax wautersii]|uniref:Esterase TesA n=1 Tax=Paracidovorax wautersii TaxID=1177982 RepID=A0A7V8FQU5_9BURK|nr:MAG: Esterase TesA [Paracidovorax wautersii]